MESDRPLGSPGSMKHLGGGHTGRREGLCSVHSHSILIADHLPKTPSCRLQSELVASTGKTALPSLSRDGDPQACLRAEEYTKFLPGKPVPMIPLRYPSSLRRPQAGISPTKEHMGLILACLHLLCLPEGLAARATNR